MKSNLELDEMIYQRIACYERGYPMCEAAFDSIEHWERATGKKWAEHMEIARSADAGIQ